MVRAPSLTSVFVDGHRARAKCEHIEQAARDREVLERHRHLHLVSGLEVVKQGRYDTKPSAQKGQDPRLISDDQTSTQHDFKDD